MLVFLPLSLSALDVMHLKNKHNKRINKFSRSQFFKKEAKKNQGFCHFYCEEGLDLIKNIIDGNLSMILK